ncbi:MAG: hypothetical protein LBC18_02475 [Opitutaceae bacterium]|jgi:cell division protein FtsB|nr:hypothetical protein [Opitutaceae bacterium]
MIAFFQKQPFRKVLFQSFVFVSLAGILALVSSAFVKYKRWQRDELFSGIKEREKNIKLLESREVELNAEINSLNSNSNIVRLAVALLPRIEQDAIEKVALNGEFFTVRPRRARPEQIFPVFMTIPRPVQPVWGGAASGASTLRSAGTVLVEEPDGRRAP